MEVEDLFVDLADGTKLLKLLEIISGEKLGKPNNGRMRVHKIENLNKSLAFLHTKVSSRRLGNVAPSFAGKQFLSLPLPSLRSHSGEFEIDANASQCRNDDVVAGSRQQQSLFLSLSVRSGLLYIYT